MTRIRESSAHHVIIFGRSDRGPELGFSAVHRGDPSDGCRDPKRRANPLGVDRSIVLAVPFICDDTLFLHAA